MGKAVDWICRNGESNHAESSSGLKRSQVLGSNESTLSLERAVRTHVQGASLLSAGSSDVSFRLLAEARPK